MSGAMTWSEDRARREKEHRADLEHRKSMRELQAQERALQLANEERKAALPLKVIDVRHVPFAGEVKPTTDQDRAMIEAAGRIGEALLRILDRHEAEIAVLKRELSAMKKDVTRSEKR